MRYFVVAFGFLLVVNAVPLNKHTRQNLSKECIAASGVEEGVVEDAKNGQFTEDEKLDLYASCILKKLGLQTEGGEILIDGAKDKLPDELSELYKDNFVNTCLHKKASTYLKTAMEIYKCYRDISPFRDA